MGDVTELRQRPPGEPVTTPWNDRNVRLRLPDGMQLPLFTGLD